ncbi:hypothetical protein DV736_g6429, partial [Chaetothyriales sp. CBS 134916]
MTQPHNKKRRTNGASSSLNSDAHTKNKPVTDPRFANIQSDPRYRLPSKKHKVKLDKRFAWALNDDDFNRRARVDRYGRPLGTHTERQRLKKKYEFEDGESSDTDDKDDNDEDDDRGEEGDEDKRVRKELKRVQNKQPRDVLREGLNSDSSSDSSSESDSESSEDGGAGDIHVESEADLVSQTISQVPEGEVTHRLAAVNLDWDNIRAQDLMAVFSSPGFLPKNGRLLKVAIYPSEFGKERMAREEMEGPPTEIFANAKKSRQDADVSDSDVSSDGNDDDDDDTDEAIKQSILEPDDGTTDFDSTALRAYQLERLRYYYAILTFSSTAIAKHIYDTVDGTEYLSTANFFDLRFVPDDTSFDDDIPREQCETVESGYKPNEFVTDALQHSKVRLTWDAEDGGRKEAKERAFGGGRKDIDENDLKAYLGTDSSTASEDEDDGATSVGPRGTSKKEAERQKLRSQLGLPAEPVAKSETKNGADALPVGGIQVTFSAGLSSNADRDKRHSVFENSPEPEETTVEKYVRKERERKLKRRERIKANREGTLLPDNNNNEQNASNDTAGEEEKRKDGSADLSFDDPFFLNESALGSNSATTLSTNKQRKEERLKKKKEREEAEARDRKERAELELLMRDDDDENDNLSASGGPPKVKKPPTVRHFDMHDIERAEKRQRKEEKRKAAKQKGKGNNAAAAAAAATALSSADGFKIDTTDSRFAALFENHEYAIDPTNPKYKGTRGMEQLLQEGRQRKRKEQSAP